MPTSFKQHLEKILLQDSRFVDEQGELQGNVIKDCVNKLDEKLIEALLQDEKAREKFFLKVKDVFVFKANDFKFYLEQNSIDNSFTQYANRIGLTLNGKYLKDNTDVVLDFPYKDCILEGGQSTEEGLDTFFEYNEEAEDYVVKQSKRKEIFYNTILAKDEIDRLLEPKAFANIKKYDKNGERIPTKFNRDKEINKSRNLPDDTITDNLLIKGNNLLALHSLKSEFKNKVKLIYIDPPYNTGSDEFKYNDKFNHSTWLTFVRNRLIVAQSILKDDGLIFINIDDNQQSYLSIVCDEIFSKENRFDKISVKTSSSQGGFGDVNPGLISNTENILIYACNKKKTNFVTDLMYSEKDYDENYTYIILNPDSDPADWEFENLNNMVFRENGLIEPFNTQTWRKLKNIWGEDWQKKRYLRKAQIAYEERDRVFRTFNPNKPAAYLAKALIASKKNKNKIIIAKSKDDDKLCLNGEVIIFYSSIFKNIDGKDVPAQRLSTFWDDISWEGISNEGGVKLRNGKKPEKLLRRIIEITTNPNDIIADYHLGSGTTCAVAHKMNRQYIGIEQLDYDENDADIRLKNVINGDKTGVSSALNWQGGGSFIYMELAKNNQNAKELIHKCKDYKELIKLFDTLYSKYFLHYNVRINEFKNTICKEENFKKLSLERQKEIFCRMLDNNQLYVHVGEMEDKQYGLSKDDIRLTKDFYQL